MSNSGRTKTALVIVALVIVAGLVIFAGFRPAEPNLEYAPEGEFVVGFPEWLILDKESRPNSSYSVSYDENLNQYTASFDSDQSMGDLATLYKNYFKDNGWQITSEVTQYEDSRGLYAIKDSQEASVAIISQNEGTQVVVSYLVKQPL